MTTRALALLCFIASAAAGAAGGAPLNGRLAFLAKQLTKASDPRVRAQNALLLGKAQDPAVVRPLCVALSDASELVRVAVVKALGAVEDPSALDCLKAHKDDEAAAVRAELERVIQMLEAVASHPPELYIAMNPVADKSGLPPDMVQLAEERIRARLQALGSVFAPRGETKKAALQKIKSQNLRGYLLQVELDSTPSGGLKVNLVCFSYPDKSLLGEVNVKASGGKPEAMIRAMAPKVIDEAADTFNWSS